jgi:hypothetical protein
LVEVYGIGGVDEAGGACIDSCRTHPTGLLAVGAYPVD